MVVVRRRLFACGEIQHVLRAERVASDAPVAAADLLDNAPGDWAHILALDAHHGVGELPDDLLLLLSVEDAFDDLYVDERHFAPFRGIHI